MKLKNNVWKNRGVQIRNLKKNLASRKRVIGLISGKGPAAFSVVSTRLSDGCSQSKSGDGPPGYPIIGKPSNSIFPAYHLQDMKPSCFTSYLSDSSKTGAGQLTSRANRYGLALALCLAISVTSCATTLSPAATTKTPAEVIELAKSGSRLELIVQLDTRKIIDSEDQSRKGQSASFDDRKASVERRAAFTSLKQRAFQGGKVGNGLVTHDFSELPMVVVVVSDLASLRELLENPLVTYVTRNKTVQVNLY